ncbi:MAG: SpaA isopeptide-forming pilin-related protein, partial [Anaerovoracaceae bacterium]
MNKRDYFFSSNGRKIFVLLITVIFILAGAVGISAVYADGESSTSGNVSYAAKWNDAGSAVKLTVTPKNAGTVYYLMQDSGETAPSEDSVKSNKSLDCTAGQNTTIEITSSDKKAKDIYVIYQETGSDSSYEMSKMTLPAYDSVSKTGSVSISAERNGSDKLSLSVTPTIDGTLKYIVKGASEDAPSDDDFNSASSISESANTTKTKQISLGDDPTAAKKVYLCYYTDDAVFVETAVMDIPALDSTSFKAEITPSELNLGTVLEGYKASDKAAVATISNTGSGTVSFSVDTTADGYDNFSKYFDVDTSGVEVIASGKQGSITVTPKEGLAAGTYSGTFYLVDKIDKDNTLTLGPVAVKMTIAKKGDGTVEGVRTPEGEYTPSVNKDGDLSEIKIDGRVAYCVNYYYTIDSSDNSWMNVLYKNKFGEIPDSTNKELDSYTGLNPNSDPVVYPPNNYNYTPVKEGSSNSTVRDNVAKVLYYGYPNDALGLRSRGGTIWNDNNYRYVLIEKDRKDLAFEIATQCAIWHYTDGIDFSNINSSSETDPRVRHVWGIYSSLTDWGWEDVQNLYNFLVGTTDKGLLGRGKFYGNATYPSNLPDAPDNFAVDLFVADNPVVKPESSLGEWAWAQNLATYSTTTPDTTTDVSITKIWADQSNADGNRPAAGTFKSWIHLYDGDENVTTTYADNLSITDNGNNTYTVTYKDLPKEGHTYKIEEVIPEEYKDNYKIPESKNSAVNGGSIKNYAPTENTDYDSLTINKEDDKGNVLEGAIFTLYSDSDCNNEITNLTKTDGNGNVTINTDASYLKDHLPTENNGTTKVYLKETTPPTGYTASDTVYTIVLGTKISSDWNSNNTAYVTTTSYTIKYLDGEKQKDELTVKNQPVTKNEQAYETLTIYKVSDAGTALSGAQFTLFSDKQCSTPVTGVTAFVTGEGGTIEINSKDLIDKQLSDDTYYLKETGVPQGYTGSDKVYEIVLDTTVSSAWNSDNTAYVTTTTHTIRCNDSKELRVRNTKKDATVKNSELTIMKSDADTSAALRGATFALYEDEAAKTKIEGSDITTDSNGQAYINTSADYLKNYLPKEDGTKTIYLKETEAPDGYQLSDTV